MEKEKGMIHFFGFGGGGTLTALGIEPCILSPGKSIINFGCSTGLITLRISLFISNVFYGSRFCLLVEVVYLGS